MRLKKLIKLCKGLNKTIYQVYVIDEHGIADYDKSYDKYKVYELFKKREDPDTIFISIYKDPKYKKLKEGQR